MRSYDKRTIYSAGLLDINRQGEGMVKVDDATPSTRTLVRSSVGRHASASAALITDREPDPD